jgi:HPt (histidine-containing phosphotransfer) domain-containing protein
MAPLADPHFRARLQALGDKFAATVPGTLDKIAAALAACEAARGADGVPAPATLHVLHELLHGVAGSAGTFGFGALGQECRRLEQRLRALTENGAGDWHAIAADTAQLLHRAARDPHHLAPGAV